MLSEANEARRVDWSCVLRAASVDVTGSRVRASGLRLVAAFEASKGLLVVLVGLELLSLIHHGVQNVGEEIVERFHLNVARHHPRILLYATTHFNDSNVRLLAFAALAYSTVRFIEAYGLWRLRPWAGGVAVLSGGGFFAFGVLLLAFAALAYSMLRFIEAYCLWRLRPWAEWFALLSGGVYLPFELYELLRHPTLVTAGLLVLNAVIVAYLVYVRWNDRTTAKSTA